MFNWNEIHRKGDLSLLMHVPEKNLSKGELKYLSSLWRDIVKEYVGKFGFGAKFIDILDRQKQLAMLKIKRAINDDRTLTALIRIMEIEIEKMQAENNKAAVSFPEMKAMVEKKMGFQINLKQVSVEEFHTYIILK